jgi:hypothetical protein
MITALPSSNGAERISLSDDIEEILAERNETACCQALSNGFPALAYYLILAAGRAVLRPRQRPANGTSRAGRTAVTPTVP